MSDNMTMHNQWRSRPADERFATLADMYAMLATEARQCGQAVIDTAALTVTPQYNNAAEDSQDGLSLVGPNGNPAVLTHWSMQQLCSIAKAPSTYLRTLPAVNAAKDLNWSIQHQPRDAHKLYLRQTPANGSPAALTCRAITSPGYARIHTANVVRRLMDLQTEHPEWKAPLVYAGGDFGGERTPCVGFAGDRDAYICLTDDEHRIADPTDKSGQGLARGIMLVNSEVGAKRLDLICFLCRYVCGNFIIWGYKQISSISLRHFGDKIRREWATGIGNAFVDYTRLSPREEEEKIHHATIKELGPGKPEIIDLLFSKFDVAKKTATDAYELAERFEPNPRTSWGMVQGLTRLSQITPNMDDRIAIDQAAAKILEF
jgi:hypothetical protein